MYKSNKKKIIIIAIILITLFEIYFAYIIFNDYRGIYQVSIFIPLLLQLFLYYRLIIQDITYVKTRFIILAIISFIIPLTIYFTLPNYTYDKGKQVVKEYLKGTPNTIFVEFSFNKDTIPLVNNRKEIFVSNRAYYYEIISEEEKKYFIVNPLTGEATQLSESYW